ncbi:hypothetical protein [Streptomyces angustmyceticus]|uniref:hypothetical protein n=1 Tax=Streptomyces angustmyceticus TaxID=285578 RepID=UPI0021AE3D23|nr:hypothetical protein [Streptomyces angustmyceticus]
MVRQPGLDELFEAFLTAAGDDGGVGREEGANDAFTDVAGAAGHDNDPAVGGGVI